MNTEDDIAADVATLTLSSAAVKWLRALWAECRKGPRGHMAPPDFAASTLPPASAATEATAEAAVAAAIRTGAAEARRKTMAKKTKAAKPRNKRKALRGTTAVLLLAALLPLTACGLSGGVGSAKGHLGVPVDVQGKVTPEGGSGTLTGKDTGEPLVSAAFAVYWPNVLAEAVAWFQHALPDFAGTLLGGAKPATAPAGAVIATGAPE